MGYWDGNPTFSGFHNLAVTMQRLAGQRQAELAQKAQEARERAARAIDAFEALHKAGVFAQDPGAAEGLLGVIEQGSPEVAQAYRAMLKQAMQPDEGRQAVEQFTALLQGGAPIGTPKPTGAFAAPLMPDFQQGMQPQEAFANLPPLVRMALTSYAAQHGAASGAAQLGVLGGNLGAFAGGPVAEGFGGSMLPPGPATQNYRREIGAEPSADALIRQETAQAANKLGQGRLEVQQRIAGARETAAATAAKREDRLARGGGAGGGGLFKLMPPKVQVWMPAMAADAVEQYMKDHPRTKRAEVEPQIKAMLQQDYLAKLNEFAAVAFQALGDEKAARDQAINLVLSRTKLALFTNKDQ